MSDFKFKFVCIHKQPLKFDRDRDYVEARMVHETNNCELSCLLDDMENFLRGCGYVFRGGLQIVEDDDEDNY